MESTRPGNTGLADSNRRPSLPFRVILVAAFFVGLGVRGLVALNNHGIYWPDEIQQSLAPAHELAFGYGALPWEYRDGARSWFFPAIIAGVLRASVLFLGDDPTSYLFVVRMGFVFISLATAWGVYRLARANNAVPNAAALAAACCATAPALDYFAHRALSESVAAIAVCWGLALVGGNTPKQKDLVFGFLLLGLAAVVRLQSATFAAVAFLGLALERRWSDLLRATIVLVVLVLASGLLDYLTWGSPFHSTLVYLKFNLIDGKASKWGTEPPLYYFETLFTSMPLVSIPLLIFAVVGATKARMLGLQAFVFLAVHSAISHKEFRFILPGIPLLFALASAGFTALAHKVPVTISAVIFVAATTVSLFRLDDLTFAQLGQHKRSLAKQNAWQRHAAINELLLIAHRRKDLCGLNVDVSNLEWTGSMPYLHRDVPLQRLRGEPTEWRPNYTITKRALEGEEVVAQIEKHKLVWNRRSSCLVR